MLLNVHGSGDQRLSQVRIGHDMQMSSRAAHQAIEVRDLSKRYGDKLAVDHLSFTVQPGKITGFLGPNGAGKSTTMRLIVGLDRASGGSDGAHLNLPRPAH